MFSGGRLLITGGTGTFGSAVLRRFLDTDVAEIRVFSRDEKKQDDMRRTLASDKAKFFIGDVRDYSSVASVMRDVDYVFHAAALKQVPSCEFFPMEAVKTNIIGTDNVLSAAVSFGVQKVICLSTDKAVYPINAMGVSKAMMERVMAARSRTAVPGRTSICGTRYGNVMASRGSVIPLFIDQIKQGLPVTVTDPNMTRFLMTIEEAVDLVLLAYEHAKAGDMYVQKAPACTIGDLARAITEMFRPGHPVKIIGTRHGEKLYETLLTREEMAHAEDLGRYYRIPADTRDLNYDKYFSEGTEDTNYGWEYTSENTQRLSVEQVKDKLLDLELVRSELAVAGRQLQ